MTDEFKFTLGSINGKTLDEIMYIYRTAHYRAQWDASLRFVFRIHDFETERLATLIHGLYALGLIGQF